MIREACETREIREIREKKTKTFNISIGPRAAGFRVFSRVSRIAEREDLGAEPLSGHFGVVVALELDVDSRIFWDYNYPGFTESVKKMDEKVNALLDEVEEKLLQLFEKKLTNIILYGSYARGDYDEESDIDIIALVEEQELKKYDDEIIDFEIELTIKYGIMPSILIENREYFTKNKKVEYLFQNVSKYGKTIYAA